MNGNVPNVGIILFYLEDTMQNVYDKHKDTDGILYITYQEQHSFWFG